MSSDEEIWDRGPEAAQINGEGLFVIIRNGEANLGICEDPETLNQTDTYRGSVSLIKETFNLQGGNSDCIIGEDLVPDTEETRTKEVEPERDGKILLYESVTEKYLPVNEKPKFVSYEMFMKEVEGQIKRKSQSGEAYSFLMVFLMSHGTTGDKFTLTGLKSQTEQNVCCSDVSDGRALHDSILSRLCSSCHIEHCQCGCKECVNYSDGNKDKCEQKHTAKAHMKCLCDCHRAISDSRTCACGWWSKGACDRCQYHKIDPSTCKCRQTLGVGSKDGCEDTSHRVHSECDCLCHSLCSCYEYKSTCCGFHNIHTCQCRCHQEHALAGKCYLRDVERDLIRHPAIQMNLVDVPKIFFIQICREGLVPHQPSVSARDHWYDPPLQPYNLQTYAFYACHSGTSAVVDLFNEVICLEWRRVKENVNKCIANEGCDKIVTEHITLEGHHMTGNIGKMKISLTAPQSPVWLTDIFENVTYIVLAGSKKCETDEGEGIIQVPQVVCSGTRKVWCFPIMYHQLVKTGEVATDDTKAGSTAGAAEAESARVDDRTTRESTESRDQQHANQTTAVLPPTIHVSAHQEDADSGRLVSAIVVDDSDPNEDGSEAKLEANT